MHTMHPYRFTHAGKPQVHCATHHVHFTMCIKDATPLTLQYTFLTSLMYNLYTEGCQRQTTEQSGMGCVRCKLGAFHLACLSFLFFAPNTPSV